MLTAKKTIWEKVKDTLVIYYKTDINTDSNYIALNQNYTKPSETDALYNFLSEWDVSSYLASKTTGIINLIKLIQPEPNVTEDVIKKMLIECPKLNDMFIKSYIKLNLLLDNSVYRKVNLATDINYNLSNENIMTKKKALLKVAEMFAQHLNIEYYTELMKIKIMAIHTDLITFFVFEPCIAAILGIFTFIEYHCILYFNFDSTFSHLTNIVEFLDMTMCHLYYSNVIPRINIYWESILAYCYLNPGKVTVVATAAPVVLWSIIKYNSPNKPFSRIVEAIYNLLRKYDYSIGNIIGSVIDGFIMNLSEKKTKLFKKIFEEVLKKK
jgi:hypothetical protein